MAAVSKMSCSHWQETDCKPSFEIGLCLGARRVLADVCSRYRYVHDELTGDFEAFDVLLLRWRHDYRRVVFIRN